MRRFWLSISTVILLIGLLVPLGEASQAWESGSYEGTISSQGIVPSPNPPRAGIRGANGIGLSVDIIVTNRQENPQNRFHFGQEIRFLFDSGPGPASVYIFGIGGQGEILYASSSHQPVPPGIKRYPPDALLFGPHGPITASPPIGVNTFQIVVSSRPLEMLFWERWIAPPNRPPIPVRKLLAVIQVLPLKYGAENVAFDFVQFCAEPPGGNFRRCPLGPPEKVPSPPVQPPRPCALQAFDLNRNGLIDDPELFEIIEAWLDGCLADRTFFRALDLWAAQLPIRAAALAGPQVTRAPNGFSFAVQGADRLEVAVHDLGGKLLAKQSSFGSRLSWRPDRTLAGGVYLAVVTAQVNGQSQRWLKKLVVLR